MNFHSKRITLELDRPIYAIVITSDDAWYNIASKDLIIFASKEEYDQFQQHLNDTQKYTGEIATTLYIKK